MPPPNVVFVLIDTLRADRLGAYGHPGGLTPSMDALAAEGTLFEQALAAAPWTQPSIASIFSGTYPGVHRVTNFVQAMQQAHGGAPMVRVFDEATVTMAELLKDRGYATAAFVANPFIRRAFGFSQGFDHFDEAHTGNETPGGVLNDATRLWLDQRNPDQPFFLYLHYMDVHGPYNAVGSRLESLLAAVDADPDKHRLSDEAFAGLGYLRRMAAPTGDPARDERLSPYREYWTARYDAGVVEADRALGSLRDILAERGCWENTYVVVTADHGEKLGERDTWDHGQTVYQTETHVPLIFRWPGSWPAGARVAGPVSLVDVLPTMAAQLGLSPTDAAQGVALSAEVGGSRADSRPILTESVKNPPEQKAIVYGPWKLIQFFDTGRCTLYNLSADPVERFDLASREPESLATMRTMLDDQLRLNLAQAQGADPQRVSLSPDELQRLRDLGYVGD